MSKKKLKVNDIYLGDCMDLLKDIEDKSIDLMVTDPPYYMPSQSYVGTRENPYKKTMADTGIFEGYYKLFFEEIDRVLKDNGTMYVFCNEHSYPIFYRAVYPYVKRVRMLVWDKKVSYNGWTWRHQHELIIWGQRDRCPGIPTGEGDILKHRGVLQKNRYHPAEKPVDLLERLIAKHKDAKIVLDPFAGSGSTLVAAKKVGKDYIGFELDEQYIKVAKSRLEAVK